MSTKEACLICARLTEQTFCPECSEKGWAMYEAIEAFLRKYPGVATIEVCREVSVPLDFVRGLVSKGYLNLDIPKREVREGVEDNKSSGFYSAKRK